MNAVQLKLLGRFDALGKELWTLQLGTARSDHAVDVTTDGQGGVFLAGISLGSLGGASFGDLDGWLARVDPAGSLLWTRQIGTSTADKAVSVVSELFWVAW